MNLTDAREFVRQHARNAGDSSMYSNADVDRAIQTVCDDFIRHTRCTRQSNTVAISSGISTISAALITGFSAERILKAWITSKANLEIVGHADIVQKQIDQTIPPISSVPLFLGFTSSTAGEVYPTPDADYTLSVQWWPAFTSFTAGTATDPGTLNLPDDYLRTIFFYGATALLQHNEPENVYTSEAWKKYLQYRAEMMGVGGLGAKVMLRQRDPS